MKKPRVFETENTLGQVICLSVLEAVAIIHTGFAYRASFQDFVNDNSILMKVLGAQVVSLFYELPCGPKGEPDKLLKHGWSNKLLRRSHR